MARPWMGLTRIMSNGGLRFLCFSPSDFAAAVAVDGKGPAATRISVGSTGRVIYIVASYATAGDVVLNLKYGQKIQDFHIKSDLISVTVYTGAALYPEFHHEIHHRDRSM